ncbi:MAG: hypothetical protein ACXVE0_02835 [Gaiellaceae bacterium]
MRELGSSKGFGFVDAKPLRSPEPAERVARYLSKYLAKWKPDSSMEVTETVQAAGRTLLNFVSRKLTAKSGRDHASTPKRTHCVGLEGRPVFPMT